MVLYIVAILYNVLLFAVRALLLYCSVIAFDASISHSLYSQLGVCTTSTPNGIRSAYHKRMKEVHPDSNRFKSAQESRRQMEKVRNAFHILYDVENRKEYDMSVLLLKVVEGLLFLLIIYQFYRLLQALVSCIYAKPQSVRHSCSTMVRPSV